MKNTPAGEPRRILIVPSFHYDVAYLQTCEAYLVQSFRILDEALRLLERHPEYRFLVEQVFLLEAYWERCPQQRTALVRVAGEGRFVVGPGLYVMPDMNHCDGESLFQQARIGRAWLEEHLHLKPDVCWIADCWGHHAQLPQILAQCGFRYYVFLRCMRRDVMRTHFLWEGLDGTRLRTHWLAKGYGNIRFPSTEAVQNAPDLELAGCGPQQVTDLCAELLKVEALPVVMLCNGGDFMVPQASAPEVVARLNQSGSLPPISFATPGDFLDALDWSDAAVVTGEFNSAFQGTFTSHIGIKQRNRALTRRLLALEALSAVTGTPLQAPDALWRPLLKQQFHDIICGTLTDPAVRDTHAEFDAAAVALADELARWQVPGGVPALFNALGFPRTETVEQGGDHLRVELPALGFAPLAAGTRLPAPRAVALPATFENGFYRATIGVEGYLTSLVEKAGGVELLRGEPAPCGTLAMQMDYGDLWMNFEGPLNGGCLESFLTQNHADPFDRSQPGELANRSTFRPRITRVTATARGDDDVLIEQEGAVSFWRAHIAFTTRMRLSRHTPRIEYETRIEPSGKHFRLRAAFPTTLAGGAIRHEIPFGVQPRGPHEHVAQHWVDLTGPRAGLALLNAGTPGNTVDDGILMVTLFRSAAMEYKAPSAAAFLDGVPHTFRYALLPHAPGADAELVRQGWAFNQPPLAVTARPAWLDGHAWGLDGDANALLSSVRLSGDDLFVRVFECAGRPATAALRVPQQFTAWAEADGVQHTTGPFAPLQGRLALHLRPFEIRNLLLRAG